MGVLDDDGDKFAAVSGTKLDALACDEDAAGGVNAARRPQGSGR